MSAADRLHALETLDAETLCAHAETALVALVDVMNRETTLLRAGHMAEAGALTGEKTQRAQDYVTLARAVQHAAPRLKAEAPQRVEALRRGHEALATQMAENLKVLATARALSESLLADVARQVGAGDKPRTYGASGQLPEAASAPVNGISVNRAL